MKTSLFVAIGSAVLATGLSVVGCRLVGMPSHDLVVAALVSGAVSLTAAITAVLFAKARKADHTAQV
jgi:hypothetical protein